MGKKAMMLGDLVPTHKYLTRPETMMSYDMRHDETYDTKMSLLDTAAKENCLILFDHDPEYVGGYVTKSAKGFDFHPI